MSVTEMPASPVERENETDSDSLSITNRTELLEILPLNSSNIIEFVDQELKNDTGVGLVPGSILENITSAANGSNGHSNNTVLDVIPPEELMQVTNISVPTGEGGQVLDPDEQDLLANGTEVQDLVEKQDLAPQQSPIDQQSTNETSEVTQAEDQAINQVPPLVAPLDQSPVNGSSEATQNVPATTNREKDLQLTSDTDRPLIELNNETLNLSPNETEEIEADNISESDDTANSEDNKDNNE